LSNRPPPKWRATKGQEDQSITLPAQQLKDDDNANPLTYLRSKEQQAFGQKNNGDGHDKHITAQADLGLVVF